MRHQLSTGANRYRYWLNGEDMGTHECSGHFDVANDLYGDDSGFAKVAEVDRTGGRYEFVLLDHGNKRLTIEWIERT